MAYTDKTAPLAGSVQPIFAGLTTERIEGLGERSIEAQSLDEIRNWADEFRRPLVQNVQKRMLRHGSAHIRHFSLSEWTRFKRKPAIFGSARYPRSLL